MRVNIKRSKRVYFMKPIGMEGPIKIGCTTQVGRRIENIISWSPFPLEIIHEEFGGHDLERKLHVHFSDLRFHHEWFHAGARLLEAISRLKAGETVVDIVRAA